MYLEPRALLFGMLFTGAAIFMFALAMRKSGPVIRALGSWGKWGGVIPPTRFGIAAAAVFALSLGTTSLFVALTPKRSEAIVVLLILGLAAAVIGGIHDCIRWLKSRA